MLPELCVIYTEILSEIYHKQKALTGISWFFSFISEIAWNQGLYFSPLILFTEAKLICITKS